ncbi:MAG: hypothetical protein ACO3SP_01210 [Ilumatobacteraceae bacterium]
MTASAWHHVREAIDFAWARIHHDQDPLNDRERCDGDRYLQYIVATAAQYSLMVSEPSRPTFIPPLPSSRWLGASGPDIDYDVANIRPGVRYRITGIRGGSSYVGICIYANDPAGTAQAMVDNVDVDALADADGRFEFEVAHPAATRVIIRQYFHDRATQERGSWTIACLDPVPATEVDVPSSAEVDGRVTMIANSIRWNAQLNQLWGADLRTRPNRLVLQHADDIVAAVPNPDVTYAFGWWRLEPNERLEIDVAPPPDTVSCRYWGLQICDRWFQSHPDRRMNLNDRAARSSADGTVRMTLSDTDPGHPNWLRTYGHTTGTMFFRWLHYTPDAPPTCRVLRSPTVRSAGS